MVCITGCWSCCFLFTRFRYAFLLNRLVVLRHVHWKLQSRSFSFIVSQFNCKSKSTNVSEKKFGCEIATILYFFWYSFLLFLIIWCSSDQTQWVIFWLISQSFGQNLAFKKRCSHQKTFLFFKSTFLRVRFLVIQTLKLFGVTQKVGKQSSDMYCSSDLEFCRINK